MGLDRHLGYRATTDILCHLVFSLLLLSAMGKVERSAERFQAHDFKEASVITEVDLRILHSAFCYGSGDYELQVPTAGERPSTIHEDEVCIFLDQFRLGLRFPLCLKMEALLSFYKLVPAQFTPNSFTCATTVFTFLRNEKVSQTTDLLR